MGGILMVLVYLPSSGAEAPSDPEANDSDDAAVVLSGSNSRGSADVSQALPAGLERATHV